MIIHIRSYLAASYMLEMEPGKWPTIAILDSGLAATSFVSDRSPQHLFLKFDDITAADVDKQLVEHRHLEQAIDFAQDLNQLLVCCRAGQSRSAATAYVLAYAKVGRSSALELLDATKHIPNKLVVQVGAEVLEMPEIVADFATWQKKNQQVKLSDYYDELEAEVVKLEKSGATNRIAK